MADFNKSIPTILRNEGGSRLVNHPNDPGGITRFGISLRFLVLSQDERYDLDRDGGLDADDIIMMDQAIARTIYYEHFWMPLGLDDMASQAIATKLLDISVLSGTGRGIRWMRDVANRYADYGPKVERVFDCVKRINEVCIHEDDGEARILEGLRVRQRSFYRGIVERRPASGVFLRGWLNRVETC